MKAEALFAKLKAVDDSGIPFVAYRKPGRAEICYLIQENSQAHYTSDFSESGFVFSPFDKQEATLLIPGNPLEAEGVAAATATMRSEIEIEETQKDRETHVNLVEDALKAIESGKLIKVVLSRKQPVNLNETDPVALFKKLLLKYADAFVYIWSHPQTGIWLGATPETLLSLDGSRFETMALAGTQPYKGTTDVLWGAKEQEEQELVTHEIASKLKAFDLNTLKIHDRESYRAGSLLHLRTRITGSFASIACNLSNLLNALHPTPAVCGLPRDLAKDFIDSHENYERTFYTGFLGEINILKEHSRKPKRINVENLAYKTLTQTTRLFVNLRCMQYTSHTGFIYVGGGITKDSIPEQEWQETVNKAQTIASIL